jgi:tRNA-splicing ligase RtcB
VHTLSPENAMTKALSLSSPTSSAQSAWDVLSVDDGVPVKCWTRGVPVEEAAKEQLRKLARLPFIHRHVAAMPDVHFGRGATVGSVVPTVQAIIPAAVGVDLGCGMMAVQTSLNASDLPSELGAMRHAIERAVPCGRTFSKHGTKGNERDAGAWGNTPDDIAAVWNRALAADFATLVERQPKLARANTVNHLGTLGTGNHFVEVCIDEVGGVWVMLHSGSRGVGNAIGSLYIEKAKMEMRRFFVNLPDQDLAYLPEGSTYFDEYVFAVAWAQRFALLNRECMMAATLRALSQTKGVPAFTADRLAVNCHHNYVEQEHHFGRDVWVTRKGAVRARAGDLGIIPGSMGAKSFIVRGRGNPESFHSCSHGAGRTMSRTEAQRRFTVDDHARATAGVECRKDESVIDETPMAYKDIDDVMRAQADLVEVVHTLKQVLCVKG